MFIEGIVVDKLVFNVDDLWMDNDVLLCKIICMEKNNFLIKILLLISNLFLFWME